MTRELPTLGSDTVKLELAKSAKSEAERSKAAEHPKLRSFRPLELFDTVCELVKQSEEQAESATHKRSERKHNKAASERGEQEKREV